MRWRAGATVAWMRSVEKVRSRPGRWLEDVEPAQPGLDDGMGPCPPAHDAWKTVPDSGAVFGLRVAAD
jgi:hypothetical protein